MYVSLLVFEISCRAWIPIRHCRAWIPISIFFVYLLTWLRPILHLPVVKKHFSGSRRVPDWGHICHTSFHRHPKVAERQKRCWSESRHGKCLIGIQAWLSMFSFVLLLPWIARVRLDCWRRCPCPYLFCWTTGLT